MRTIVRHTIFVLVVVAVAGHAIIARPPGQATILGKPSTPLTNLTATTLPWPLSLLIPASDSSSAPRQMTARSAAVPDATGPTAATIKAVVQRRNQEQQAAFANNQPSLVQDTSTSAYYDQIVQTNQDLANAGVSAIKLVNLEWVRITLQGATTAQVTTVETWQTSYRDGSTVQSRDRNQYTPVQVQGTWKVQTDDHSDANLNDSPGPGISDPSSPIGLSLPGSSV